MIAGEGKAAAPEHVDVSQLWLADGACEQLARHCDSIRAALGVQIEQLARVAPVTHVIFGDCEEGRGWSRVVGDRVAGPTGSLTWLLEQHRIVLTEFADTIRRIGAQYRVTDEDSAGRYARLHTGIRP